MNLDKLDNTHPPKIVTLQPVYHTLASYLWNNYVQPKNQYDIINEP